MMGEVLIVAEPMAEMIWCTPFAELVIERVARECYQSMDGIADMTYEKLIRKLMSSDPPHTAMLEHATVALRMTCDRGVSHELVRHRLASYAQQSTRYCNYASQKFGSQISLMPMLEGLTEGQLERRMKLFEQMQEVYLAEIREGVRPQQARDVLPTCLKTTIIMCCNLTEWRHVLKLRFRNPNAHPQMRKLMARAFPLLYQVAPIIFEDFLDVRL